METTMSHVATVSLRRLLRKNIPVEHQEARRGVARANRKMSGILYRCFDVTSRLHPPRQGTAVVHVNATARERQLSGTAAWSTVMVERAEERERERARGKGRKRESE